MVCLFCFGIGLKRGYRGDVAAAKRMSIQFRSGFHDSIHGIDVDGKQVVAIAVGLAGNKNIERPSYIREMPRESSSRTANGT